MIIDELKFDEKGLIPAIVQDEENNQVLMLAYMNRESFQETLRTGKCTYFSRSRQKLWLKGETSGHFQHVKNISYDCDADTLLIRVRQEGAACHTGERSCFYRQIPLNND
jgi:phosphoribosyl-AMP cyclohydrolase